jgi:Undecaprenyl-phosphate glucose phosphotransferase
MRIDPDHTRQIASSDLLKAIEPQESAEHTAPQMRPVSAHLVAGFVKLAEAVVAIAAGLFFWVYYWNGALAETALQHIAPVLAVGVLLPLVGQAAGLHTIRALTHAGESVARIGAAWSIIFAALASAVFFVKMGGDYSRLWLAAWYLAGFAGLASLRVFVSRLAHSWNKDGRLARRAIFVGGGETAAGLAAAMKSTDETDIKIVGIFDDRNDDRSPQTVGGYRKLGNVSDLIDFVRRSHVDLLIVTFPLTAENRLLDVLKRLWVLPVDIRLSAYSQKLRYRPRAYSWIGNVPFLDVFDKPLSDWGALVKSAEDRVISAIALLLLSPVMLAIALAVRLESKGPAFFRQRRFGFNNELIEVLKFRSMYTEMADAKAEKLVTKDDPRVTRVGKFIRRTSLDELPQLINVLKGDLSLVGPRPHPERAKADNRLYNDVVEGYFARHRVKPGITGWAQVNGWRGETDTAEKIQRRVEHDLYYIENWSLGFDLYILWKTPFALLKAENAY